MAHPSPFASLEAAFRLLSKQTCPLAIDGRQLGHGAPARQIPASKLRSLALHPAATPNLQDAVLDAVITRLQHDQATWIVVLGGILLPSMRCLAERISIGADGQMSMLEIEAELLWRLAAATRRPPAAIRRFAIHLLTDAWT
jgi:hypothetical protein